MANPSNLYAEKIFSEHPISLWALDDQVDYISLISESQRDISTWTKTNATVTTALDILDEPFTDSITNKLVGATVSTSSGQIKVISPNLKTLSSLDSNLETFSIGMYIYVPPTNESMISYELGYEYTDPATSTVIPGDSKEFQTTMSGSWFFISETFKRKNINAAIRIVFKANYINGYISEYPIYVNGITIGQWSEEFAAISLGESVVPLPLTLSNYIGQYGIEAKAYGLDGYQGYYLCDDNSLFATNTGVPMVYGASNVTVITPNTDAGKPSLIIPGHGFLNSSGKYNEYTVEFWINLETFSSEPRRIFGPTTSPYGTIGYSSQTADGIYADGPFVRIKIGNNIGSHFIGDWSRPMLFDFKVGEGNAGLLVNGEQVISMTIDIDSLSFADEYSTATVSGARKHQDWLGFYAYDDIPIIKIDCPVVYSYQVSSILAKRRFAYGQAVDFPEASNTSYGGTSVFIDYPFADYTNNYNYPGIGKFNRGISDNLIVESNSISSPKYKLPDTIFLNTATDLSSWIQSGYTNSANANAPSVSFSSDMGYLYFENLNVLKDDVKALYGIFTIKTFTSREQLLIKIKNKVSGDYLSASIKNNEILYKIKTGTSEERVLYTEYCPLENEAIFVGLNINSLSDFFSGDVLSFFSMKNQLSVYIARDNLSGSFPGNGFTGEINKIGFCNENNLKKILKMFNSSLSDQAAYDSGDSYFGVDSSYWTQTIDGGTTGPLVISGIYQHTASYTLIPKYSFGKYVFDIVTSSYWEDYLPMSYFAQYINSGKRYDLDFIQFNISYPALPIFTNKLESGATEPIEVYDTSKTMVKTYVTFKYDKSGVKNFDDHYLTTRSAPAIGTIYPGTNVIGYEKGTQTIKIAKDIIVDGVMTKGSETKVIDAYTPIYDDFYNTRYEVVDGTIIYPPRGVSVKDLSISTHIEIITSGAANNQVKIKSLQYASQAFNNSVPNPVGTRFGNNIYPYKQYGLYYDYKANNPFRIYKGSTPYLYLTRDSGIQKVGTNDPLVNAGLAIPLNENVSSEYKIIAMQTAVRFNKDKFSSTPEQIFEIEGKDSYIKFFMVANDSYGKRARIYAINAKTGNFENGIAFYQNGKLVREPVITPNSWNMIGINFSRSIDLNYYTGAFRINGQLLTNVTSFYKSTNLQEIQKSITRPWFRVRQSVSSDLNWKYWSSPFSWDGVLVSSTSNYYGIDPAIIYKSYTGTNKIIVDDYKTLNINSYEYVTYNYLSSQTQVINAV